MTRCPKQSTCALLDSTERSTEKLSCAVTARMPGTLLALIATPSPVPHTSSARSALPSAIMRAAATATCGYAVSSSAPTPTSVTSTTRSSACRSPLSASLYSYPASSEPTTILRPDVMSAFSFGSEGEAVRDGNRAHRKRRRPGVGCAHAAFGERPCPADFGSHLRGRVCRVGGYSGGRRPRLLPRFTVGHPSLEFLDERQQRIEHGLVSRRGPTELDQRVVTVAHGGRDGRRVGPSGVPEARAERAEHRTPQHAGCAARLGRPLFTRSGEHRALARTVVDRLRRGVTRRRRPLDHSPAVVAVAGDGVDPA